MEFYLMEAATIVLGAEVDAPSANKFHTLENVKLPKLEEKMQEHHGAGSPVAVNIPVGINAFTGEFKLTGTDPQAHDMFAINNPYRQNFTIFGALRDHISGIEQQLKAVMNARLSKIETDGFKKGDLHMTDYAIDNVMMYRLYIATDEKIFFSYANNTLRVNGEDRYRNINRMLRIPSQQN